MGEGDNYLRFGVFEVLPHTGELRKSGLRIKLEDQPFAVLMALLQNPGTIVTRDQLRESIWPDGTVVDFDKSLTKAVNKIRAALDDSATNPRFVETVSRRGYRFIAPVTGPDEPAAMPPIAPRSRVRWWLIPVSLATVLTLAVLSRLSGGRSFPPVQSVVVLPFVNLTGDPGQEYFADGLTDDLISDLARIGSVRIISYTTSMRYKKLEKSAPQIARELQVDSIIEGSVQRGGDRLRLNVKLVRAATDRQLWSESYTGDVHEAIGLEGRILPAVAHQISAHLSAEATARLGATANPRAYDSYLRGRYLWNLRGKEAITQASAYFQQAVSEDPGFALAWSGLADSYTIGWHARYDPALGERYARKALALAPNLAEAHVSLGFALDCQYNWAEAEKELKRGIALNSNYVPAHQLYAVYLMTVGRLAEALAENDRALQLDPFSLPVNNLRGLILIALREYDRAEQQLLATAQIDPQNDDPRRQLARIYWLQQKGPQVLAVERRLASGSQQPGGEDRRRGQADVEAAFVISGFHEACLRSAQLKERLQWGTEWIALQYGVLQDKNKVMYWLNRSITQKRYGGVYFIKTAQEFDFLRSDRDFQNLLRRIGLSPAD